MPEIGPKLPAAPCVTGNVLKLEHPRHALAGAEVKEEAVAATWTPVEARISAPAKNASVIRRWYTGVPSHKGSCVIFYELHL